MGSQIRSCEMSPDGALGAPLVNDVWWGKGGILCLEFAEKAKPAEWEQRRRHLQAVSLGEFVQSVLPQQRRRVAAAKSRARLRAVCSTTWNWQL